MPSPSVQLLSRAVWALLDGHPHLAAYASETKSPELVKGGALAVGYAVFHPGGGDPLLNDPNRGSLTAQPGQLLWTFQVTVVGNDFEQIGQVIDTIRGLLDGKTLTVAGAKVGRMQPPFGYQPPPPRPQQQVQPARMEVPLQYQVLAVNA